MNTLPITLGTRIHSILYGGRDGTVVQIAGESRIDNIVSFSGISTGGNAEYDIVWDDGTRSMRVPECIARGVQWHLLDEPMVPEEEIPALLLKAERHSENLRLAEVERKAAKEAARQSFINAHPELTPCEHSKGGAKNLRIQLKQAFPGVKFSVTSDHSSININWTDGPTIDQVEKITDRYSAGHFDGMNDCYEYNHDRSWPFGETRYVFTYRAIAEESLAALDAAIAETFPEMDDYDRNRERHQITRKCALPLGHRITGIEWIDDEGHAATHEKISQSHAATAH